jgi:hypothetical protein
VHRTFGNAQEHAAAGVHDVIVFRHTHLNSGRAVPDFSPNYQFRSKPEFSFGYVDRPKAYARPEPVDPDVAWWRDEQP